MDRRARILMGLDMAIKFLWVVLICIVIIRLESVRTAHDSLRPVSVGNNNTIATPSSHRPAGGARGVIRNESSINTANTGGVTAAHSQVYG
jgi:hypothetical protein